MVEVPAGDPPVARLSLSRSENPGLGTDTVGTLTRYESDRPGSPGTVMQMTMGGQKALTHGACAPVGQA